MNVYGLTVKVKFAILSNSKIANAHLQRCVACKSQSCHSCKCRNAYLVKVKKNKCTTVIVNATLSLITKKQMHKCKSQPSCLCCVLVIPRMHVHFDFQSQSHCLYFQECRTITANINQTFTMVNCIYFCIDSSHSLLL